VRFHFIPKEEKISKWEIRNLYLGDYGEEIAKKLVSYVVNKYGGEGRRAFVAYIPEKYNLLVNLLKKECLFRSCANVEVWQSELKKLSFEKPPLSFRDLKSNDIVPLLELYNFVYSRNSGNLSQQTIITGSQEHPKPLSGRFFISATLWKAM
jgi:hypothetical protein